MSKTVEKSSTTSQVREFVNTFGVELSPSLWERLCGEEHREFLKEACDFIYVMRGYGMTFKDKGQQDAYMKGVDEIETYVSNFFETGKFDEAFRRVHQSNMSKLGDDGKPIKREDGKILKGPNYKEPDLKDL